MSDRFRQTAISRRAQKSVKSGRWTAEDWYEFCELSGRYMEDRPLDRADWDAWFEVENNVIERLD